MVWALMTPCCGKTRGEQRFGQVLLRRGHLAQRHALALERDEVPVQALVGGRTGTWCALAVPDVSDCQVGLGGIRHHALRLVRS